MVQTNLQFYLLIHISDHKAELTKSKFPILQNCQYFQSQCFQTAIDMKLPIYILITKLNMQLDTDILSLALNTFVCPLFFLDIYFFLLNLLIPNFLNIHILYGSGYILSF